MILLLLSGSGAEAEGEACSPLGRDPDAGLDPRPHDP